MNKMRQFLALIFLTAHILPSVTPLDFKPYEEGPCENFPPQEDFDHTWFANNPLPYIGGGSKYHLYRMIFQIKNFKDITEDDFYYKVCFESFVNTTSGVADLYAFNMGVVARYRASLTGTNGIIDFEALNTTEPIVSRHTATLTDGKTFIFFATCWQDVNQKAFDVFSSTLTLDSTTQKLIADHAISLGFNPDNFIFFPDDMICGRK